MLLVVLVAGSIYTCAKASIGLFLLSLTPVKSIAGTVTRHGSLAGSALVLEPPIPFVPPISAPFWHGSVALVVALQAAILALNPFLTGPALPLLPGSVLIESPTEKLPDIPFCIAFPKVLAPFPETSNQSQLPGAKPPTNFDPNVTV